MKLIKVELKEGEDEGLSNSKRLQAALDSARDSGECCCVEISKFGKYRLSLSSGPIAMYPEFTGLQNVYYCVVVPSNVELCAVSGTVLYMDEKAMQHRYQTMFYLPPGSTNIAFRHLTFFGGQDDKTEETFEHAILSACCDKVDVLGCHFTGWRGKMLAFMGKANKTNVINFCEHVRVKNCTFTEGAGQAIHLGYCLHSQIKQCHISDRLNDGAESIIAHGCVDVDFDEVSIYDWGGIKFRGNINTPCADINIYDFDYKASPGGGSDNRAISVDKDCPAYRFELSEIDIDAFKVDKGQFIGISGQFVDSRIRNYLCKPGRCKTTALDVSGSLIIYAFSFTTHIDSYPREIILGRSLQEGRFVLFENSFIDGNVVAGPGLGSIESTSITGNIHVSGDSNKELYVSSSRIIGSIKHTAKRHVIIHHSSISCSDAEICVELGGSGSFESQSNNYKLVDVKNVAFALQGFGDASFSFDSISYSGIDPIFKGKISTNYILKKPIPAIV